MNGGGESVALNYCYYLSSIFIPVTFAVTLTGYVAVNLYFTEKDQNEKIQELTIERGEFLIDFILQAGFDTDNEIAPKGKYFRCYF
ncbi:hypothetical protein SFC08_16515 [Lysinibacillus halotolerans]